jgi:hypothetical protein
MQVMKKFPEMIDGSHIEIRRARAHCPPASVTAAIPSKRVVIPERGT